MGCVTRGGNKEEARRSPARFEGRTFHSADDTGGDYFDWQTISDGRVVISLADVMGHGIGPALLASVCRAYARSSFRAAQDLKSALESVNEAFGLDLTTGRFTTFAALVCSPGCSEVQVCSAGHGPILLYSRAADRFVEIQAHALPLGILQTFNCDPPSHLQLGTGDIVLLSTDGFFEWENDKREEFGIQRVQDVIRTNRDHTPSEIVASLYASACDFSNGAKQQDDLTAVAIKRI
jgi:phosphoserine phosphatase RsbU/P